jgi:hypothetical protein
MRIVPFSQHISDVFLGEGWYEWIRVKHLPGKRPVIIGQSIPLPKGFINDFLKQLRG